MEVEQSSKDNDNLLSSVEMQVELSNQDNNPSTETKVELSNQDNNPSTETKLDPLWKDSCFIVFLLFLSSYFHIEFSSEIWPLYRCIQTHPEAYHDVSYVLKY